MSQRRASTVVRALFLVACASAACGKGGPAPTDAGSPPKLEKAASKSNRALCVQRATDIRAGGSRGPVVGRMQPGALVNVAQNGDAGDAGWVRVEDIGPVADREPFRAYVERSALGEQRFELIPPKIEPGSVLRATFGIPMMVWYDRESGSPKPIQLRRCHEVWLRDRGAAAFQNLEGVEIFGSNENTVVWNGSPSIHQSLTCPAHAVVRRGAELSLVEPNPRWDPGDAPGSDVRTRGIAAIPEGYRPIEPPSPDPLALAIERGATLHWLIATDAGPLCETWRFERVRSKPDAGVAAIFAARLVHSGRLARFDESGFWYPAEYHPSAGGKPAELHLETVRSARTTMRCDCDYRYRIVAGRGDELYALGRPIPDDAVAFEPTEAERWFLSKKACETQREHAIRAIERDGRTTTRLGFHATELL
jgi:hypothetical protein